MPSKSDLQAALDASEEKCAELAAEVAKLKAAAAKGPSEEPGACCTRTVSILARVQGWTGRQHLEAKKAIGAK